MRYLVELDNMGVPNFLKDFDLTGDAFNVFLIVDFLFLQDFDGHLQK